MVSIKITLAVDRSRNRVLFADAGSDFVDVLLSFLTLPLSAVQFCAAGASSPGCLSNLCDSVDRLRGSKLLKVEACHGMLLTPEHYHEFGCYSSTECNHSTFGKKQPNLQVDGTFCRCLLVMARLVHVYAGATSGTGRAAFVRCKERFLISDDWTIKPASPSTIHSLIDKLSSDDAAFHGFEEVEVCVGWEEVVSMLKASLSSDTIFTDVFLSKGTDDLPRKKKRGGTDDLQAARVTAKPASVDQKIIVASTSLSESNKIKLFYDRQAKKVMYSECKHDFVDLLLGFLTYPVGCLIKNMTDGAAVTSHLASSSSSFDNLYTSAVDLDAAGFLTGSYSKVALLNPPLSPLCVYSQCLPLKEGSQELENYMGLLPYSSCNVCCNRVLVEDREYVVGDDLLVHQASAMSVMKHWHGRHKVNVVEMDITIGKKEAVLLLQAVFTSKTALTDVFISRLEEHSSLQKMQIFAKFHKGNPTTVEVARWDTIATLKSRINNNLSLPVGCLYEMTYEGRCLEDSCTVAHYNIVKERTVLCRFLDDGLLE